MTHVPDQAAVILGQEYHPSSQCLLTWHRLLERAAALDIAANVTGGGYGRGPTQRRCAPPWHRKKSSSLVWASQWTFTRLFVTKRYQKTLNVSLQRHRQCLAVTEVEPCGTVGALASRGICKIDKLKAVLREARQAKVINAERKRTVAN